MTADKGTWMTESKRADGYGDNGLSEGSELIVMASEFVRKQLGDDASGHDWQHAYRVANLASCIAVEEGAAQEVVLVAAWLHDVDDYKLSGDEGAGARSATSWLQGQGANDELTHDVAFIIRNMSYRGALVPDADLPLEGKCVRDADRLDAMGAIGVARAFAYGGHVGRLMYEPDAAPVLHDSACDYRESRGGTLNHFMEKLLLLQDRLETETARAIGRQRHDFMAAFVQQFMAEWDGSV